MGDLDLILGELVDIAERIARPGPDDDPIALRIRRDELRAEARRLDPASSEEELRRELERLEERWDELRKRRIDVVKQAGGSPGGDFGFVTHAMELNREIDRAGGRAELEERIRELKRRLTE